MNKENARKLYKMGMAIFDYDDKVNPERMSINEIDEDKNYYAIVGENQLAEVKQVLMECLTIAKYVPQNVSLDNIVNRMAMRYIACIENVFCEELALDSIGESVAKFFKLYKPVKTELNVKGIV